MCESLNLIDDEDKGLKTYSLWYKHALIISLTTVICFSVLLYAWHSLFIPLQIQYASESWHAFIMVCSTLLFEVSPEQLIRPPPLMEPQHKMLWMPYYWLLWTLRWHVIGKALYSFLSFGSMNKIDTRKWTKTATLHSSLSILSVSKATLWSCYYYASGAQI